MPITLKTAEIRFKQSDSSGNKYSSVVDIFTDTSLIGNVSSKLQQCRTDISTISTTVNSHQNLINTLRTSVNSLSNNVVLLTQQTLTAAQKAQVKANLGISDSGSSGSGTTDNSTGNVKYDRTQSLSETQQSRARTNIGLGNILDAVNGVIKYTQQQDLSSEQQTTVQRNIGLRSVIRYDSAQNLTESQKAQARVNLGLGDNDGTGSIKYDKQQNLTTEEQSQARANIGLGTILDDVDSVVKYTQQTLTDEQKEQVQENIGLNNINSLIDGVVRYDNIQELTTEQKTQAQNNIGLGNINSLITGAVKYDSSQNLSAQEKAQARTNIGAISGENIVLYSEVQNLTDNQKLQARTNIGASSSSQTNNLSSAVAQLRSTVDQYGGAVEDVTKSQDGLTINYINGTSSTVQIDTEGILFDGGYVDEKNYLHLTYLDVDLSDEVFTPILLPATGGGGNIGGGTASIIRITSASIQSIYGETTPIEFTFTAADSGGDPVGSGIGTWYIGGLVVARNVSVAQGNNSFDIGPYLTSGINNVKISISVDTGDDSPRIVTKTWTVNAIDIHFTWDYDDSQINTSSFSDRWIPYGNISKTTHTLIDGQEFDLTTTTRSGIPISITIPMQSHGAHSIERWITATINGISQQTPHQYHQAIFAVEGNNTPIVAISYKDATIQQYQTIKIPVVIYDPRSAQTNATLIVDDKEVGQWENIDRTLRYWNYTPTSPGAHTLSIQCGQTINSVYLTVTQVVINTTEIPGYNFKFKASQMASNITVQNWESNGVTASFSNNFDWINGGLHTETDSNGNFQQYFCIKAGTRMIIDYKLFESDPKVNGMNYKMIFKVKNVRDYQASLGGCYANNIGIRLYAHQAIFNSSGTSIRVPYREDDYIELQFDVYPAPRVANDNNYRYIMAWIDGVITSCRVYGQNDNFVHVRGEQAKITLGSDDCDIYLYLIKSYPMLITRENHIDNFIMDAPNAYEMINRNRRNDILDESGEINYEKLMEKNPDCRVWLYDIPYLTTGKKDYVTNCKFNQFWPNGEEYYQLSGIGTMSVQGTSSVQYIRGAANTDINFTTLTDGNGNNLLANGIIDSRFGNNLYQKDSNTNSIKIYENLQEEDLGPEYIPIARDANGNVTQYIKALGFKLNDNSCPITYSNTKVNFASCQQVNNMCNAAWYQRFNPYPSLTARDCMEFNIGVQFIKDQGNIPDDSHFVLWNDNKYHMYSIANMGNSKKNIHVLHDLSNPNEVCIEVNDNDKNQMRMVSDDLSAEDWSGDVYYGMRYPDTKNPSQAIKDAWQTLVSWMADRNPSAYTGQTLSRPETYGIYTFRGHDREGLQVLKGTSVKKYAGTYTKDTFERRMARMLSECEDHMVMDSFVYHYLYLERHTMVDNVSKNNFWSSTDLIHWDLSKAYDMDTSDGNNNQGQMVFDYGNEYNDDIGGMKVFNGADSVWFVFVANLYEACRTMFLNREAEGAWSASAYHNFLLQQQRKIPERCWNQCYWYDYLRTYEQGISSEWMTFLDGGQKTHQRGHYEFFQELYDSSKYRGIVSTSQTINFRAYTPNSWRGVRPKGQLTISMYNKMYLSIDVGTTSLDPMKIERGVPTTIDFSSGGTLNNTLIVINTAPMIQQITGMQQLYPDTCVFSMATKLRQLKIGSNITGYQNTFLKSLALDNNTLLERLQVQNLPNATSVLNLSNCPSLQYLDANGSGFTGYEFADGGLLNTATIHAPVSLSLKNLSFLTDQYFVINDYSKLTSLRCENTPINSLNIITNAENLQILRVLNVNWGLDNQNILKRMADMQGFNEMNYTTSQSVITGVATISLFSSRLQEIYATIWPNFEIRANTLIQQHDITFLNQDGSPILNKRGEPYIQYVDKGGAIYDPIQAGEIDTPTKQSDAQYIYTFSYWDNINGAVTGDRIVTAVYTQQLRTYTVRWYKTPGVLLKQTTTEYGNQAYFSITEDNYPTVWEMPEYSTYYIFKGWDKSTGSIIENTDVYAVWEEAILPEIANGDLQNLTPSQIFAVAKQEVAGQYWVEGDSVEIILGKDYNFSNVQSTVLLENRFFDKTTIQKTNTNLFSNSLSGFTIAIDYEFTTGTTEDTLFSCYDASTDCGLRLYYDNGTIKLSMNDTITQISSSVSRNIIVIRYKKGDNILRVYTYKSELNLVADSQKVISLAIGRNALVPQNAPIVFGGILTRNNTFTDLSNGWIHWCKVWYDDLGDYIANQLTSSPHFKINMKYFGEKKYRKATGERSGACFVSSTYWPERFNSSRSYNSSSYFAEIENASAADSAFIQFITNTMYNALPIEWQSIISLCRVPEYSPNAATVVNKTYKVWIPCMQQVYRYSSSSYDKGEGEKFPWTSSSTYYGICAYQAPSNARFFNGGDNPATMYTLSQGDIWNHNNALYSYLPQNKFNQHYVYNGGITRNDSNFIRNPNEQGCWIYAYYALTRSMYGKYYVYENAYGVTTTCILTNSNQIANSPCCFGI